MNTQSKNRKIGYLSFGRDDFAYGLNYCLSGVDSEKYRVSPKTAKLVLSMLSTRAGAEFREIEKELSNEKIIQIQGNGRLKCNSLEKLISVLKKYGGVEKYCGDYTGKEKPCGVVRFQGGAQ